jgi:hypothetical protein
MNFRKLFKQRRRPQRPSPLMEKVERIETTVTEIQRALTQQQQKPAQTVQHHDTDTAAFEPDEPFTEPEA